MMTDPHDDGDLPTLLKCVGVFIVTMLLYICTLS